MSADAPGDTAHGPDAARRKHTFEPAALRDGETPDETSHARRNELAKASLEAADHAELPANEHAAIELLAALGETASGEFKAEYAATTSYEEPTGTAALSRLADKDLVRMRPNPDNWREHIWRLTDAGRAWVRDYGRQR